ncbi:MAG: histidine phosphatase family protein [Pseudomonadota bacterium]|nr:histidine phosphatase family protein [Pseudomonadota bacterium]
MRHGHTAWNRAGRIQGRVDEPLDDQAREHLSNLRLPEEFEGAALFSSPLVRAVETARIIGGREPIVVPALIEMDWGLCEGRCGIDLLKDDNSGYRHIEEWGWDFRPPEGETPGSVWERLEPWLSSVEGPAVVISHIGIMRVLLARASGWNFHGPAPFRIKRDRLYRVHVHDDGTLSHDNDPVRLIQAGSS